MLAASPTVINNFHWKLVTKLGVKIVFIDTVYEPGACRLLLDTKYISWIQYWLSSSELGKEQKCYEQVCL